MCTVILTVSVKVQTMQSVQMQQTVMDDDNEKYVCKTTLKHVHRLTDSGGGKSHCDFICMGMQ